MSKYHTNKARARELAITWQYNVNNNIRSFLYYATWYDRFCRIGRKYGLLREFRENGII